MPVKIRLKREGRKKKPFYHIVIADGRAPRDGRFIEKIGYYNPNTNPATIELEFDKALSWLQKGAQPTDTCRAILSYKGVLYKNHLLKGAQKGAFSEEEAEKRFKAWMEDKEARIAAKAERVRKGKADEKKQRLTEEAKVNQARAEEIAKKQSKLVEEIAKAAEGETEESVSEEAVEETQAVTEEAVTDEVTKTEESPAEPTEKEPVAEEKPAAEEPAPEPEAKAEDVAEEEKKDKVEEKDETAGSNSEA